MHPFSIPVFKDIAFNRTPIEEYLPMEPLHPMVFDQFMADGWCYWSDLFFRRNYLTWRSVPCRVIILRINLAHFEISKSQRKCLRRNQDLRVLTKPIQITKSHERLFERHSDRLENNRPISLYGFFSRWSHLQPCTGLEFNVLNKDRHVATSYFHVGHNSMAGNYCIHEPEEGGRSLGTYTMLLEIEHAILTGKSYYYPGLVYDVPSEFDYKLNFNGLEYFDWWGNWYPLERLAVRRWRESYEQDWTQSEQNEDGDFSETTGSLFSLDWRE